MKYNRIKKTLCLIAALALIPAFAVGCSNDKSEPEIQKQQKQLPLPLPQLTKQKSDSLPYPHLKIWALFRQP